MREKYKVLRNAEKYVVNRQYDQAIREYKKLLKTGEEDPALLNSLGDLLLRSGKDDEARSYFKRVAEIFSQAGFVTKAIGVCKKIHRLDPSDREALHQLVDLYTRRGVSFEAASYLRLLVQQYQADEKYEEAAIWQRRLLELDPSNADEHVTAARLFKQTDAFERAVEHFITGARLLLRTDRHAEAYEAACDALKIDGNSSEAMQLMIDSGQHLKDAEPPESSIEPSPLQTDEIGGIVHNAEGAGEPSGSAVGATAGEIETLFESQETLSEAVSSEEAADVHLQSTPPLDLHVDTLAGSKPSTFEDELESNLQKQEPLEAFDLTLPDETSAELPEKVEDETDFNLEAPFELETAEPVDSIELQPAEERDEIDDLLQEVEFYRKLGLQEDAKRIAEGLHSQYPGDSRVRQSCEALGIFHPPGEGLSEVEKVQEDAEEPASAEAGEIGETLDVSFQADRLELPGEESPVLDDEEEPLEEIEAIEVETGEHAVEEPAGEEAVAADEGEVEVEESASIEDLTEVEVPETDDSETEAAEGEVPEAGDSETEPVAIEKAENVVEEAGILEVEDALEAAETGPEVEEPEERFEEPAGEETVAADEGEVEVEESASIEDLTEVEEAAADSEDVAETEAATKLLQGPTDISEKVAEPLAPFAAEEKTSVEPENVVQDTGEAESPAFELEVEGALDAMFCEDTQGSKLEQEPETIPTKVGSVLESPDARYDLGLAYREMGMLDDAVKKFQEAYDLFIESRNSKQAVLCCTMLAATHFRMGDFRNTIKWANYGVQLGIEEEFEWKALEYDRARALEELQEFHDSLAVYRQIHDRDPDYRDVQARMARIDLLIT